MQLLLKLQKSMPYYLPFLFVSFMIVCVLLRVGFFLNEQLKIRAKREVVLRSLLCIPLGGAIGTLLLSFGVDTIHHTILFYFGLSKLGLGEWLGISLALIASLSLPAAILGMVLFATMNLTKKNYKAYIGPPIGLAIIFIGGSSLLYHLAISSYGYTKNFWEELGIPKTEAKEKILLVFTQENKDPHLQKES